tara:strand:- start:632 stop:1120 length:489 start_codon:yes stop_codon:yes gene_type:complete
MRKTMAKYSFKSAGTLATDRRYTQSVDPKPIGIKTPLSFGIERDGIFQMHFDNASQIKDNLRNLLMTNFGERVGLYTFGADLRSLVGELTAQDEFESEAMMRITQAVATWMPMVELDTFESRFLQPSAQTDSMTTLSITVVYSVPSLRIVNDEVQALITVFG